MQRKLALALVFVVGAALPGCATADNANNRNAATPRREGVVETNANIPANANRKSVPANTGVLTNDNGNANTDGVKTMNSNNHNANKNQNQH